MYSFAHSVLCILVHSLSLFTIIMKNQENFQKKKATLTLNFHYKLEVYLFPMDLILTQMILETNWP